MTIEIKVTNTEVVSDWGDVKLRLYGRTKEGDFDTITVKDYPSYIFAPTSQIEQIENSLIRSDSVQEIVHTTDFVYYKNGEPTSRVEVDAPWNRKEITEAYSGVDWFWGDVWLDNQFRIEHDLFSGARAPKNEVTFSQVETFDASTWDVTSVSYIDIEADDRGEFVDDGSRPIISIVGWNNYEESYTGFFWTGPDRTVEDCFPDGRPEGLDALWVFDTEKQMLEQFQTWVSETNPDVLTGWNFDYDAGYLHRRFDRLDGLDPAGLTREGYAKDKYSKIEWKGRSLYDLKHAYQQKQFTEKPSYRLEAVAQDELGTGKIDHPDLGYWEMWEKDPDLLLRYNVVDVELCVRLNDEISVISFWERLRDMLGLDYEDTTANNDFVEMHARRTLWAAKEVADPKDYSREESGYEGAHVADPYYGVASNVVAVDLASLYPMTMFMANTSPEAKVSPMEAARLREEGVPVCHAPNNVFFRLDEDGVYKRMIDEAIEWKAEYKELRNQHASDPVLHKKYDEDYNVSKTVTNSPYGVSGWEPFFLYDEDVALAITSLGQACIKETQRFVDEETNGEVIYGDTDSNYIQLPGHWSPEKCVEWAHKICDTLNNEVYPALAEEFGIPAEMNEWLIEPEAFISSFFQAGKKKRYAYRAEWVDGAWLDEPKDSVKGFDSKRSDTAPLTKNTQNAIFSAILSGDDPSKISEIVREAAGKVDPTDPDWEAIGIPGGIGKDFEDYATETAHVRGARYLNLLAGTNIGKDDKPKRVYLKPTLTVGEQHDAEEVDVISFESWDEVPDDLAKQLRVDAGKMTNKIIEKPLGPICEAVGVDVDAAIKGQTQTGLDAYL